MANVVKKKAANGLETEGAPWKVVSPDAKRFVEYLMKYEWEERPTSECALRHPWLLSKEMSGEG